MKSAKSSKDEYMHNKGDYKLMTVLLSRDWPKTFENCQGIDSMWETFCQIYNYSLTTNNSSHKGRYDTQYHLMQTPEPKSKRRIICGKNTSKQWIKTYTRTCVGCGTKYDV